MRLKSLVIVWCVLLTMGCASPTTLSGVRQSLPANLLTPCPDLEPLNDGSAETILRTLVENSQLYYECQSRQASLAAAVQPLSPAGVPSILDDATIDVPSQLIHEQNHIRLRDIIPPFREPHKPGTALTPSTCFHKTINEICFPHLLPNGGARLSTMHPRHRNRARSI